MFIVCRAGSETLASAINTGKDEDEQAVFGKQVRVWVALLS